MSMMLQEIEVAGRAVLAARDADGRIWVALRPMVQTLGLSWSGQRERVLRDPVLAEGVRVTRTPSGGGEQETLLLDHQLVAGFLFGINASRVREDVRGVLIAFQRECFRVLDAHFNGGVAEPVPPGVTLDPAAAVAFLHDHERRVLASLVMQSRGQPDRIARVDRHELCATTGLSWASVRRCPHHLLSIGAVRAHEGVGLEPTEFTR